MAEAGRSKESINLTGAAIGVLLRLAVFVLYYVLLIAVGLAVLYAAYYVSCIILTGFAEGRHYKTAAAAVLGLAALWAFAGTLGFYLIKPLFSFSSGAKSRGIEVEEEDCPLLFYYLRELAENIGVPMPKHVYLTEEVNAAVFYSKGFWRLFLPVGKDMEIGLGLCRDANIDEFRVVLAHELGHFSQRTMKLAPAIGVTMAILADLVYTRDKFDSLIDKWRNSDFAFWSGYGKVLHFLIGLVKRMTSAMYGFVERGYTALQRQTELDADLIACRAVSTAAFISSQLKLDWLTERHKLYEQLVSNFMREEGKCPEDYWAGYEKIEDYFELADRLSFDALTILNPPAGLDDVLEEEAGGEYGSHPTTAQRIKNALAVTGTPEPKECTAAWDIFEPELVAEAGRKRLLELAAAAGCEKLQLVSTDEFRKLARQEFAAHILTRTPVPE